MPNKGNLRSNKKPFGSIQYHGNYVGPGWSAGKYQDSVVSDVPAIDEFDKTAKEHDAAYALGQNLKQADLKFASENIGKGVKRTFAGVAVGIQGLLRPTTESSSYVTPDKQPSTHTMLTRSGTKRKHLRQVEADNVKRSLFNSPGSAQMGNLRIADDIGEDSEMTDVQPMVAIANTAADNMGKETKVSIPPTITYGYQETHTTILPMTFYLGTGAISSYGTNNNGIKLDIQLNTIYAPLLSPVSVPVSAGPNDNLNNLLTQGITMILSSGGASYTLHSFPDTYNATTSKPAYRAHWAGMYDYYTVLGCEYAIKIINTSPTLENYLGTSANQYPGFQDVEIYKFLSGNTTIPAVSLNTIKYWKNVQKYMCYQASQRRSKSCVTTISGVWKPGDYKRDVRDDSMAKVWTAVNASPALKEVLSLRLHESAIGAKTGVFPLLNLEVTLKFIVQFKDLTADLKYPSTALWS